MLVDLANEGALAAADEAHAELAIQRCVHCHACISPELQLRGVGKPVETIASQSTRIICFSERNIAALRRNCCPPEPPVPPT